MRKLIAIAMLIMGICSAQAQLVLPSSSASSGGSSTPCTTVASSLQYNNAGAFGCVHSYYDGVQKLAIGNSATAQSFLVYNTVDTISAPTNYERGVFDWTTSSNVLTIGTQAGGTGNGRPIVLASAGSIINFAPGSFIYGQLNSSSGGFVLAAGSGFFFGYSSLGSFGATSSPTAIDTVWYRDAATSVLALGNFSSNSTPAGFRVYNTSDNVATGAAPTNYERGVFDWTATSNVLTMGTQKGGTGTARDVQIVAGGSLVATVSAANNQIIFPSNGGPTPSLAFGPNSTNGFYTSSGNSLIWRPFNNNTHLIEFFWDGTIGRTGIYTDFVSIDFANGDIGLFRDGGAGLLALENYASKTSPTTFRVYNTTDTLGAAPTNYERGVFDWSSSSNVLSVGTQTGGTGTGRNMAMIATGTAIEIYDTNLHVRVGTQTAPALTACGTTPTILGTDVAGQITAGTATPTGCTLTFNSAYANAPFCNVTWQSNLASMIYTIAATGLNITQTGTNSDKINYTCHAQNGG